MGANGGGVHGRHGMDTSPAGSYLNAAGTLAPPNTARTGLLLGDLTSATHSYNASSWGWTVGAQVGCNRQLGSLVLGVEADFNWARQETSVNAFYPAFASVSTGGFTIS